MLMVSCRPRLAMIRSSTSEASTRCLPPAGRGPRLSSYSARVTKRSSYTYIYIYIYITYIHIYTHAHTYAHVIYIYIYIYTYTYTYIYIYIEREREIPTFVATATLVLNSFFLLKMPWVSPSKEHLSK